MSDLSLKLTFEQLPDAVALLLQKVEGLEKIIAENGHKQQGSKEPEFYTRKKAAEVLSISLPTLSTWTAEGILKSYKSRGRVLYKACEVSEAITKLEKK